LCDGLSLHRRHHHFFLHPAYQPGGTLYDHHGQSVSAAPARISQLAISRSGFVLLYLFLAIVLPFLAFAYASFLAFLQPPSLEAFRGFTLKNYRFLAQYGEVASALKNTVVMVVVTATMTVVLPFWIAGHRAQQVWGRNYLINWPSCRTRFLGSCSASRFFGLF